MDDLTESLRDQARYHVGLCQYGPSCTTCGPHVNARSFTEAADRIDALTAEVETLRAERDAALAERDALADHVIAEARAALDGGAR